MTHFRITCLCRSWKGNRGDDLAVLQGGCEQALEEVVRSYRALVGLDGRARRQHGGGGIPRRGIVRQRGAEGAPRADLRGPEDRGGGDERRGFFPCRRAAEDMQGG